MIFAYKFKQFNIENLRSFVWGIIQSSEIAKPEIGQIRFHPEPGRNLFTESQLGHLHRNLGNDDFSAIWKTHSHAVKTLDIDQFDIAESKKIKMSIDFQNNTFVFDKIEGVDDKIIKNIFEKNFVDAVEIATETTNVWWKYTHPVWWIWFFLRFVWRLTLLPFRIFGKNGFRNIENSLLVKFIRLLLTVIAVPVSLVAFVSSLTQILTYFGCDKNCFSSLWINIFD